MESKEFDFESFRKEAISKLQNGEGLLGEGGAFTPLLKAFLEQALEGEVEAHLSEEEQSNRKNGKGKKIVRTSLGEVEISTPRDRQGSFQPQVIPKSLKRQILLLSRINWEAALWMKPDKSPPTSYPPSVIKPLKTHNC